MSDQPTSENQNNMSGKIKTQQRNEYKKIFLGLTLSLIVILLSIALIPRITDSQKVVSGFKEDVISPSPTPMPFEEMTIPALRSRTYKSTLESLEQVAVNESYTSYKTSYLSDGLRIFGQLTIPRDDRPLEGYGAIIFVHGYIPPDSYQTFEKYVSYVDYLAKNGFVIFKIDLRGHGESDGEPGGAYYSSDYVIDVLNARAALQSADFVNPEKVGLWGHSMAGNVILRSLAVEPSIPAAVIWAGAVYTYDDWVKYGIEDGSYRPPANAQNTQRRRQRLIDTYGSFDKTSPFWSKFAATNYLADIKGAIQLNHAVDDPVVNIGYSRDLNELLNSNGISHEFHEYGSGGHNFTGAAFSQAMQNTVDFFKKYLN